MSETNGYSSGYFTIGSKLYRRDNKGKNIYISNFFFELKDVINTDSGCKYKVEIFVDIDDDVCNIHTGYCSFDEFKNIDFFKLDRHLDIPTFMRDFISWIYSNFDEVTQSINNERQIFMKKIVNDKGRYRRLNIAEFIFQVVFNKVLEYGIEIKAVSNKECCELMKGFAKRLCECKERQQMVMERLEKEEALNNISYAKAFVDCIENNIIKFDDNISSDKQCFVHTVKNIKCIYIRSEYLTDVLNYQYDQKNTVKFYANYFAKKNLLYRNKDSNVVKYEGKCYMAIRIDRLKIEVYSDDYKIDKLFI